MNNHPNENVKKYIGTLLELHSQYPSIAIKEKIHQILNNADIEKLSGRELHTITVQLMDIFGDAVQNETDIKNKLADIDVLVEAAQAAEKANPTSSIGREFSHQREVLHQNLELHKQIKFDSLDEAQRAKLSLIDEKRALMNQLSAALNNSPEKKYRQDKRQNLQNQLKTLIQNNAFDRVDEAFKNAIEDAFAALEEEKYEDMQQNINAINEFIKQHDEFRIQPLLKLFNDQQLNTIYENPIPCLAQLVLNVDAIKVIREQRVQGDLEPLNDTRFERAADQLTSHVLAAKDKLINKILQNDSQNLMTEYYALQPKVGKLLSCHTQHQAIEAEIAALEAAALPDKAKTQLQGLTAELEAVAENINNNPLQQNVLENSLSEHVEINNKIRNLKNNLVLLKKLEAEHDKLSSVLDNYNEIERNMTVQKRNIKNNPELDQQDKNQIRVALTDIGKPFLENMRQLQAIRTHIETIEKNILNNLTSDHSKAFDERGVDKKFDDRDKKQSEDILIKKLSDTLHSDAINNLSPGIKNIVFAVVVDFILVPLANFINLFKSKPAEPVNRNRFFKKAETQSAVERLLKDTKTKLEDAKEQTEREGLNAKNL